VSFEFEARLFRSLLDQAGVRPRRVAVVGCGAGVEVRHLAEATGAEVVGLDLTVNAPAGSERVRLLRADARALPFRDGAFEALYCYHVLEHVPEPARAVREARRVLAPGGLAYFGTPNKSRLVGYLGGRATAWEKVTWNLVDWWRRATGRWSNEQGAHAGFTERELGELLAGPFEQVVPVSLLYYVGKYPGLQGFWRASYQRGWARFVAPSTYFCARATGAR
jgi:SAM-dependent methyltransferase